MSNRIVLNSLEDLKDLAEDFILFIGTSHTVGECVIGDQTHIEENRLWVNILSSMLGIKYVKLSFGGAENCHLSMMLNSFIRDYDDFSKHCKLVIADVRLGSYVPYVSRETLHPDPEAWFPEEDINKMLNRGNRVWQSESGPSKKITKSLNHLLANQIYPHGNDVIQDMTTDGRHWGGKYSDYNKLSLESFLNVYIENWGTSHAWQKCFYDIVSMSSLTNAKNVPFRWFTFNDNSKYFGNPNESPIVQKQAHWRSCVQLSIKNEYNDIWEENLLLEETDMSKFLDDISGLKNSCECGHYDQQYQPEISKILFKKLVKSGIKI